MNRERLEAQLAQLPLLQYEFIDTKDLVFSERIRHICRTECPMYGKSWACPPAVGEVDECQKRCLSFDTALLISTIAEVSDIANIDETLATRAPHEAITRKAHAMVREQAQRTMALSTEACAHCEKCTYPDAPCRFPEKMYPCVESHGIIVTDLAEKYGIQFLAGGNLVTWFSLIFFNEVER